LALSDYSELRKQKPIKEPFYELKQKESNMNKGTWTIFMGFATGSPHNRNESWFNLQRTHKNCTLAQAIDKTRSVAYKLSDDICADWVFHCEDRNGKLIDAIKQAEAELESLKIMFGKL
jgi:hypothetical protein